MDENWELNDGGPSNLVPDGFFGDHASIANGGTAVVNGAVPTVANLTVSNGTIDIRSETLASVLGGNADGGVVTVGGAGSILVSGSGELTAEVGLTNNGLLSLTGSDAGIIVDGDFANNGLLRAAITGNNHGLIDVGGDASLGGTLQVRITGVSPTNGSSWNLIQAGSFAGEFAVDTSQAPPLPRGLQYRTAINGPNLALEVGNALVLTVDRTSGDGTISNVNGTAIEIDGYAVTSDGGLLAPAGFTSLGGTWTTKDGTANVVAELNLTGASTLDAGTTISIGSPYAGGPARPAQEDLHFQYTSPNGDIRTGIVEYTGPINDIVLAIDPTTGNAEIRNLSPHASIAASIDGYTVTSESGALMTASWTGLANNAGAGAGWRQGTSPSANGLAELNLDSSTQLSSGTALAIGEIFDTAGTRDLVFQYSAIGSSNPVGDANGDGMTNLTDFNTLKANFGATGATLAMGDFNGDGSVDLTDFNLLKANFGATGQPGEAGVFTGTVVYGELASAASAAVPEPSTLSLAALAAVGGVLCIRRRKERKHMNLVQTVRAGAAIAVLASMGSVMSTSAQAQDNQPIFGTVGSFTGGDPGEGLDFEGVFQYAVNSRGPGGLQVGDALFTDDSTTGGFTIQAENEILNWAPTANYGDTPNDNALETVMNSIRWSSRNSAPLDAVIIDLDNLINGADYKLQLLFAERCCERAFAITINDELAIQEMFPNSLQGGPSVPSVGAVYTHEFTAASDSLHIELNGNDTPHPDGNAIFNGLTLELDVDFIGDFNFDGDINLSDFDILLDNIPNGSGYDNGDIDFSGNIDLQDFVKFKTAYNAANAAAAVPEPSAFVLAALAFVVATLALRRKR